MIFKFMESFLKWFLRYFYSFETYRVEKSVKFPKDQAQMNIKEKLKELETRDKDEVDAKPYPVVCTIIGISSSNRTELSVPKSKHSFIKFDPEGIIQTSPHFTFRGTFMKRKVVAVKDSDHYDADDMDDEMKIAEEMKHHEGFLAHLFAFEQDEVKHKGRKSSKYYIATEYYEQTLETLDAETDIYIDVRDIMTQLADAVDYMHTLSIAHCCLCPENVAIIIRGNKIICKITNFCNATKIDEDDCNDLRDDIEALGKILQHVYFLRGKQAQFTGYEFLPQHGKLFWSLHDDILCLDLIDKMRHKSPYSRPTLEEVKAHPFLCQPRDTLHLIVQAAKLLEAGDTNYIERLRKSSKHVFDKDWRFLISSNALQELDDINRKKLPYVLRMKLHPDDCSIRNDIITLIKTIRNLVRKDFLWLDFIL